MSNPSRWNELNPNQLSVISYQLSVISYQLSVISYGSSLLGMVR
ncbi:hypothetical protein PN437_04725 [Microcystis aeruginosa CS-564/01]|nr:hypothetical protein [Microcystis aeruginosa CS-564/01]